MKRRSVLLGITLALACKADLKTDPGSTPSVLTLLRGNQQQGEVGTDLPIPPAVLVTTESGTPAEGVAVTFAVIEGNGSAARASVTTGPDGIADAGTWTLGTVAGVNRLAASATGLTGSPAVFSATGQPGAPAQAELITPPPPAIQSGARFSPQPVLQLQDLYGNPDGLAGSPVTVSLLPGSGASLIGTTTVLTDESGTAPFIDLGLTGAAGDYTLVFDAPPVPALTVATHLDPGAAAALAKQAGDNQTGAPGSILPVNPAVVVRDAGGNPVSGVPVTFAVAAGGGSVAGGATTSNAQGLASSGAWTLGPAAGANTVTATVAGIPAVTFQATATVAPPGPPASIVVVSGDGQSGVAGGTVAESLVVRVRDAAGTGVPGVSVAWTVLAGGGSVSSSPTTTGPGGLAAVAWTLGTAAGSNVVRATVGGLAAQFTGNGVAGPATTVARGAGNNQTATVGTPVAIDPAVIVRDANGNPVGGVSVAFAVSGGGGSIEFASGVSSAQGIATGGRWTLGPTAGANQLTATAAGLAGSPVTFGATGTAAPPGPPASIVIVSGDGQSGIAGNAVAESLVVQVRDAGGLGVPGVSVAWTVQSGGGSVSPTPVSTGPGGLAAVAWTLGTAAGGNTVSATSAGFTIQFSATGIAGAAATLARSAGNNQTATVGTPVAIDPAVIVRDANGNPVAGVVVGFAVSGGGGSIESASGVSSAQGIATGGHWTLGPAAGANQLTATAAGLSGSPVTFAATGKAAPPGPPASIVIVSGDGQTVDAGEVAPESLVVQVRDAGGLGVPGVSVAWTIQSGGGSVSPTPVTTDQGGLAAVAWTVGLAVGSNTVAATAAGFTAQFTAAGVPGPPATLTRNSGNNQTAPAGTPVAVNPTVLVRDGNGNPVPGVTVGFAVAAGGGSIELASGVTNGQGVATGGTWTLGPTAGSNQLTATVPGLAGSPTSFFATGTPTTGPPASLVIVLGDNQAAVAGDVLPESLVVKVADAGGTGVPGVAVSWTVLSGGGTVSSSSVTTDLGGLAAVLWALGTTAGANSVEASAAGFTGTFSATGQAGPPSHLAFVTQPGPGQSGVPLGQQPVIQLEDVYGNAVPQSGVLVTAVIGTGGGALEGATQVATDGAGIAGFTDLAVSGLVGPRTLVFSSPGLPGLASLSFSIAPGPASILARFGGDNQSAVAGTPVATNPRVLVTDDSGNPVSGVPVTFSVSSGGGTIAFAADVTNVQGRASGGVWTLGPVPGPNTLTAVAAGLTGSPAVFTATGTSSVGAPASIAKVDGDNQTATAGTVATDSLVAQVLDANNNGVPGVTVTWTVLGGGGSVSSVSGTSDAGGLAAVAWTLGVVAGPNAVRASAAGFNATFTATGVAGPPATLTRHAGDNQSAQVGTAVAVDPAVLVVDSHGNPVPGVAVTFTVISGNGTIATPLAVTDPLGVATGGSWTLGPVAGANTLRAASSGLTGSPTQFSATGTAAPNTPVPLMDMGAGTYFGFPGGLYPTGNTMPAAHATAGAARARNVRPRSFNGNLNPNGKFVLLSIGLSNTSMEWCTGVVTQPCDAWSFMGQAAGDGSVNHQTMVIANGARPGQEADTWDSPTDINYDLVRDNVLQPQGLSEKQVEIVWLKVVNGDPQVSLPSNQSDAVQLVTQYGDIVRALKVRYPNLEMVFFSSRIYAGYATLPLNPEPYAYESGFAVKWVIEAQIDQMANGGTIVDPRAGNLNRNTGIAPWIGWGPYTWADGLTPRSDGLIWTLSDYQADRTHPSAAGVTKVAGMLLNFFKNDARTGCWFRAGQVCP